MGTVYARDKYKYDYYVVLREAWKKSGVPLKAIAIDLGINVSTTSTMMHGCYPLTKHKALVLIGLLDINLIEWCCKSKHVLDIFRDDLTPYACSMIRRITGDKTLKCNSTGDDVESTLLPISEEEICLQVSKKERAK